MKKLIRSEVTRCEPASFQKNIYISRILLYAFCLNFLRTHHNYFFWRCFEIVQGPTSTLRFWKYKWKLVLLVFYLFNYDSSTHFLYVECGIWRCLQYSFCQINKLEFFVSCNTFLLYAENKNVLLFSQPVCFDIYFIAPASSASERRGILALPHVRDSGIFFPVHLIFFQSRDFLDPTKYLSVFHFVLKIIISKMRSLCSRLLFY